MEPDLHVEKRCSLDKTRPRRWASIAMDEPVRPWDVPDVIGSQVERFEPSCGGKSNEEKDRLDARTRGVQQRVVGTRLYGRAGGCIRRPTGAAMGNEKDGFVTGSIDNTRAPTSSSTATSDLPSHTLSLSLDQR